MSTRPPSPPCRVCRSKPATAAQTPFCSERCRKIDLGNWLDGAYRIARPLAEREYDEGPTRRGHVLGSDPN